MSWSNDLLKGIARLLADNGIGEYSDDPGFVFSGMKPGISLKRMPSSPDQMITLSVYGSNDHEYLPQGDVSVQVRVRGARNDHDDPETILDAIFDLMHNARYIELIPGQPPISRIHRKSSVPMGVDANNRWETADNYKVFGYRPSTHR